MKTKDLGLASLLVSNRCRLNAYEMDELGQMWFEFADEDKTRGLEESYCLRSAIANVQEFLAAQKMLKALIFEHRNKIYEHRINKSKESIME